jgi:hypothetical protein
MRVYTGRTRKVRIEGVLAMTRHVRTLVAAAPDPGILIISRAEFTFEMYWRVFPEIKTKIIMVHGIGRQTGYYAEVQDGYGNVDTDSNLTVVGPPTDMEFNCSITDGTYYCEIDAREWYEDSTLSDVDANNFPKEPLADVATKTYLDGYGTAYADGPPGRKVTYGLSAVAGGYLNVGVSGGGVSASLSTVIPAAFDLEWQATNAVWSLFSGSQSNVGNEPGLCRTIATYHDFEVKEEYLRTSGGTYCRSLGQTFEVVNSSPNDGNVSKGFHTVLGTPPELYKLRARARAFNGDLPVRMDARYFQKLTTSGILLGTLAMTDGSVTVEQVAYTLGCSIDEVPKSGFSRSEKCPMRLFLDQRRITDTGDDSRDWRCLIKGRQWPIARVRHVDSEVLDNGSSTTGWAATNGAVSTSGGAIVFTPSGSGGSLTRTFSPEKNTEGHRYLRVRIRSVGTANQAITVGIAGQTWDTTTGADGTWVERDLDLLCSSSESGTTETRDSRNPIENPGGYPTATLPTVNYSLGWGVSFAAAIAFTGLPATGTIQVDYIELRRTDTTAYFSPLAPFLKRFQAWDSGTDITSLYPFWYGYSDGRVVDWPHLAFVDANTGPDSYTRFTLSQLRGFIAYPSGWECDTTGLPADPDAFHTSSLDAYWFMGGGSIYTHSTEAWTANITSTPADNTWATYPAQMGWDEVQGYPGIGRGAWDGSAYDLANPALPCAVEVALRARSEGVVFRLDDQPYPSTTVRAYETSTPANITGTGVTDAKGRYTTGTPYARGNKNITTKLLVGSQPSANRVEVNRERDRTSFRKNTTGVGLAYAVSRAMRHARAYSDGGTMKLGFAENVGYPFSDVDTGLNPTAATLDYSKAGLADILRVCVCESGTIKVYVTSDESGTLTLAITVGTGTYGAVVQRPDGVLHTYRLASGTVYTRAYDARNNALYAEQTTNLTGLDNSEIDTRYSVGEDGKAIIGLIHSVGGALIFKTSQDGITFS